ncbi:MAG: hypothetical protein AAB359_06975, partial [Elusimicrobiota bacterium]
KCGAYYQIVYTIKWYMSRGRGKAAGDWDSLQGNAFRAKTWESLQGLMADGTGYKRQGADAFAVA